MGNDSVGNSDDNNRSTSKTVLAYLKGLAALLTAISAIVGTLMALGVIEGIDRDRSPTTKATEPVVAPTEVTVTAPGEDGSADESGETQPELPGSSIVFKDLFLNPSSDVWKEQDDGVRVSSYESGMYTMELRESRSNFTAGQDVQIAPADDFLIEVTGRVVEGEGYFYGLFWEEDWTDQYFFELSPGPGGVYSVYRNEGWTQDGQRFGETQYLVERSSSLAIKQGDNTLTVVKTGGDLDVYINGTKANQLSYTGIPINRAGFSIGGELMVEFTRIAIRAR